MSLDGSRAFRPLALALATVSDTRGPGEDASGDWLAHAIGRAGHRLSDRRWVHDDADAIAALFAAWVAEPTVEVVLATGGTGVTGRDVTPEALERVAGKLIPGFGELFRWLSFASIGTSTIQSRACAGVAAGTYLFALPGSTGAVRDAWEQILVYQLDSRHRPCNFAELIPRLQER